MTDKEINTRDRKTKLQAKEQECKNLEEELRGYRIGIKDISIENTEICKISEKYKRVLDDIEKQVKAIYNDCFYDDICDCNNCDMKNGCAYYRKFNILNIIKKAKEKINNGNTLECPYCNNIVEHQDCPDLWSNEKHPDYKKQEKILKNMQKCGFNVVTCGICGGIFLIEKEGKEK